MDLNRLSTQQQWAVLLLLVVLLASPYAIKRFWPAYQLLVEHQQRLSKNQNTIKNPNYPESPIEDEEDILANLQELQQNSDLLSSQTDTLRNRIPALDSQDILLELSTAARVNNITIVENIPYLVQRVAPVGSTQASKKSDVAKTDASQPLAKLDKEQRRAQRGARGTSQMQNTAPMTGVVPREGELIYEVVNKLDEPRPLQRIVLQGTYFGLMGFIESIRNLPVQVTLVSMNIDTLMQLGSQNPQNMQGMPQLIRVSVVVAL